MLDKKVSSQSSEEDENNVVDMTEYMEFSKEEINEHLGIRNSGEHYPREFINVKEYNEFIELCFLELGDSRLFVNEVK